MILTCPACGTQYAVKDGAIPAGGRKVRCASCGHSWHQQPDPQDLSAEQQVTAPPAYEPAPPPAEPPAMSEEPPPAEPEDYGYDPAGADPEDTSLAEPPAGVPVPPIDGWPEQPTSEAEFDISKELPDRDELNAVRAESSGDRKRSWLMGILLAVVLVVVIVLALWFIAPDSLRQKVGFASAGPSALQIAPGAPERQKLASGNELVVISGRVINPSSEAQTVPPIEAQLRDKDGKLVYSWTIAPPARTLPPGGSASFNSAEMDVPASGLDSTVTLTLKG